MTLLRTQLGNTLRGHRLRQRRTLRDVSGAARVSLGYLSEVERGQKEASSELLASICDALDVELADLLAEVSLELRLADGSRRPVRPLAVAEPAAESAAQVAEAPAAVPAAEAPAAEPALALVGGAQPARDAARAHGAVRLAASGLAPRPLVGGVGRPERPWVSTCLPQCAREGTKCPFLPPDPPPPSRRTPPSRCPVPAAVA